jgi:hypothetical protein
MMPPQLARAKRPKRSEPRPLVELLPRIDIVDLCRWKVFPSQYDWYKAHLLELPFRYPFVKSLIISLQDIEFNHHSDYNQIVPLRWCRTARVHYLSVIAVVASPNSITNTEASSAVVAATLPMQAEYAANASVLSCKPNAYSSSSNTSLIWGRTTVSVSQPVYL